MIELLIFISFIMATTILVNTKYVSLLERKKLEKQNLLLISTFKVKFIECKNQSIYFNFNDKYIKFDDEKLLLADIYEYESKNKEDKKEFKREITKNCNLDKPFTIVTLNNKGKLSEMSFNSINALEKPIIEVRYE
ncbi:hypothetical protein [Pseudostreptobacillus hongkongensis]|uniref:hypothetical protein n=1 Tax=Pseudostreptobacillus hongkongensis TaxID=1162717 RepID=UPI000834ED1A|nr:hypothetical protein [Pseudostreptobacillus hongkongensis]